MDNIAGSPVEGENFFGRNADLQRLLDLLKNHDVLLLGPRRIGKTSLSRAVMQKVQEQSWHAIEINVAACSDEKGFLEKLAEAVHKEVNSVKEKIKSIAVEPLMNIAKRISSLELAGVSVGLTTPQSEDWTKVANDLLGQLAALQEPWLIYVDELPIMLFNLIKNDKENGIQRVRRFLDWFRNDVRGLACAKQVRWLVSGSVGLDTLVQQYGMADTINSMKHEGLPPFTTPQAMFMILQLFKSYQLPFADAEAAILIDAIKWLQPYYIQLAFYEFRQLYSQEPHTLPTLLLEKAVNNLTEAGKDNDFHFWQERLSTQLSKSDANHAIALLNQAANTPEGVKAVLLFDKLQTRMGEQASEDDVRQKFIELRDILVRDAYWIAAEHGGIKHYRFQLEPLRRWWQRRYAL